MLKTHLENTYYFIKNCDITHKDVIKEMMYYSNGYIDPDNINFEFDTDDDLYFYYGVRPLNDYTQKMLNMNNIQIIRYNKLLKIRNK
jgi:hypothetical protein